MAWPDPLEGAPRGEAQLQLLCARAGDDLVRDVFCGPETSEITGLAELQAAMQVPADRLAGLRGLAITAHSTAVSARSVSAINPRVIAFQLERPDAQPPVELSAVAFVRGEQTAELVVRERRSGELQFYLLKYRQPCNDAPDGCLPGDLLTPVTESGWTQVSVYDEEDLKNTTLDCRQCHQPQGPGTPKLLRMQEYRFPWTHWIFNGTEGGRTLLDDYRAAHGDETYGGIPGDGIERANPSGLELLVSYSSPHLGQPNEFLSGEIEAELARAREAALEEPSAERPVDWVLRQSPTWRRAYERARSGDAIPVPFPQVRVTDPDKLAAMTAAYADYRDGDLAREALPDIRDVFLDDPYQRAAMGFATEPGLGAETTLVQACAQCHNDRLDQGISRASFDVELDGLTRAQKDAAIERVRLPASDVRAMPPPHVRRLSPDARAGLIRLLER
jgi:mono/diheme cytochrome c family protein